MKLEKLKAHIKEVLYVEDDGILEVLMATVIANQLQLDKPVWLILVGSASSGKTQMIFPLSPPDNPSEQIHPLDNFSQAGLLSGNEEGKGFLHRIIKKHGILLINDMTVLLSKPADVLEGIMGIFRTAYDGSASVFSGKVHNKWEGYLGIITATTPTIYQKLSESAGMGERFIYYNMKPLDYTKVFEKINKVNKTAKEIDNHIAEGYREYFKEVLPFLASKDLKDFKITEDVNKRLIVVAKLASNMRTPVSLDFRDKCVDRIPVLEAPTRVFKQLKTLARAFSAMNIYERGKPNLSQEQIGYLEWIGFSMGDVERRSILEVLAHNQDKVMGSNMISAEIGLPQNITERYLNYLVALDILRKDTDVTGQTTSYLFKDDDTQKLIMSITEKREVNIPNDDIEF